MYQQMIAFAAVFVIDRDGAYEIGDNGRPNYNKEVDLWQKVHATKTIDAEDTLVEKAYTTLHECVQWQSYTDAKRLEKNAQSACELLGWSWADFRAEAEKKTRVPKELQEAGAKGGKSGSKSA
jgi:hypothetical protein